MYKDMKFPIFTTTLIGMAINKFFYKEKLILPIKKDNKPTLILDPTKFLCDVKFSFLKLDYLFYKKKYSEEFLFNLANLYEIIFVNDRIFLSEKILRYIDPLQCISYNLFIDKKHITKSNINRDLKKLVILSSDYKEYGSSLIDNIIKVDLAEHFRILKDKNQDPGIVDYLKKNNNFRDGRNLLTLVNFLYTLSFNNSNDFRSTIKSYFDKFFFVNFENVQRKIYSMRNMLNPFVDYFYSKRIDKINTERIETYKKVKEQYFKDIKMK